MEKEENMSTKNKFQGRHDVNKAYSRSGREIYILFLDLIMKYSFRPFIFKSRSGNYIISLVGIRDNPF